MLCILWIELEERTSGQKRTDVAGYSASRFWDWKGLEGHVCMWTFEHLQQKQVVIRFGDACSRLGFPITAMFVTTILIADVCWGIMMVTMVDGKKKIVWRLNETVVVCCGGGFYILVVNCS